MLAHAVPLPRALARLAVTPSPPSRSPNPRNRRRAACAPQPHVRGDRGYFRFRSKTEVTGGRLGMGSRVDVPPLRRPILPAQKQLHPPHVPGELVQTRFRGPPYTEPLSPPHPQQLGNSAGPHSSLTGERVSSRSRKPRGDPVQMQGRPSGAAPPPVGAGRGIRWPGRPRDRPGGGPPATSPTSRTPGAWHERAGPMGSSHGVVTSALRLVSGCQFARPAHLLGRTACPIGSTVSVR